MEWITFDMPDHELEELDRFIAEGKATDRDDAMHQALAEWFISKRPAAARRPGDSSDAQ